MKQNLTAVLILLGAGFALPARADVWTFASAGLNGNYGTSKTFTSTGGVGITASGFLNTGATQTIYGKYTVGFPLETGLGFTNEVNNEINNLGYIELDLSNVANNTLLSLAVTSLQSGESFNLYQANTAGGTSSGGSTPGGNLSLLVSNPPSSALTNSPFLFQKTASFRYIAVEAQNANVLIGTLSTVAPEPQYFMALLLGLTGLVMIAVRRRRLSPSPISSASDTCSH